MPGSVPADITITIAGTTSAQEPVIYRQHEILARYGITNLVLMRSSGVLDRFDPACFPRTDETPLLVVLRVQPGCGN